MQQCNEGQKTSKFFVRHHSGSYPLWRLKSQTEHEQETGIRSKEARKYIFNCLDDMAHVSKPNCPQKDLLTLHTSKLPLIKVKFFYLTVLM